MGGHTIFVRNQVDREHPSLRGRAYFNMSLALLRDAVGSILLPQKTNYGEKIARHPYPAAA